VQIVLTGTTVLDFGRRSFVEWDLKDRFYERLVGTWYVTQLQLMFRTRRRSGLLFKLQNAYKSEHVHLEVRMQFVLLFPLILTVLACLFISFQ